MTAKFTIGQKVQRKGKFYIVCNETYTPPANGGWNGDVIGVLPINKKTGQPWQSRLFFHATECSPA